MRRALSLQASQASLHFRLNLARRRSYRRARRYVRRARRGYASFRGFASRRRGLFGKSLPFLVGLGTGIQQIVEKDVKAAGSTFQGMPIGEKLKWVLECAVGRVSGMGIGTGYGPWPQTINPGGMVNKWTGLGVLFTWLYPMIPKAPGKSILRKAGTGMLGGGIIGGLFDPTPQQQVAYRQNVYIQPTTRSIWS